MENLTEILVKISPAFYFIGGLIVKHLFEKFINRISKLNFYVHHSFLGSSTNDPTFGDVTLLYNNNPVENLYITNVRVINGNKKDFSNLQIKLWCDSDSDIIVANGKKINTIQLLNFTDRFNNVMDNFRNRGENSFEATTSREYLVPVLNRGEILEFSCLTTNINGDLPYVSVDCSHSGLKVNYKENPPALFWNEPQHICAYWGLIITILILVPLMILLESKMAIGLISFFLGAFLIIPGAIIVKLKKKIENLFL